MRTQCRHSEVLVVEEAVCKALMPFGNLPGGGWVGVGGFVETQTEGQGWCAGDKKGCVHSIFARQSLAGGRQRAGVTGMGNKAETRACGAVQEHRFSEVFSAKKDRALVM